jgi:ABC-type ATPase involved in cell division
MTEVDITELLERYSEARISLVELRRALGRATFADVLIEMAKRDLSLPRASEAGRQQRIAAARAVLFPKAA